jgi:hypothetical protein
LALKYAIRKLSVNVKGTLEYHTTQIVGYADDICLLSRNIKAVKETYQELSGAAKEIGLSINVSKTQAMILTRSRTNIDQQLRTGDHNINMVNKFIYLGSCITEDNNEQLEIQRRLKPANKAYYSLYAIMKSCDIHKKTKIRLYKTLIRTVLTRGYESWKLTKKSEDDINSFERKILRRIFWPVNENGQWRNRYNKELYELYRDLDLGTFVKLKRLHVQRLPLDRIAKKDLGATFTSRRPVGKPRKR